MNHTTWKQRAGWLALMGCLLTTGALAQVCAQEAERPSGRYWAGLVVTPASDVLRDQLQLDEGQGLIVERVAPDSPASEADIKPNDVLIKAGDRSLGAIADLMQSVQGAEGKPIELTLLRAGERKTVSLKPAERTAPEGRRRIAVRPPDADDVVKLVPEGLPQQVWRMLRPGLPLEFKFPDDLTLSIEKQGDQPGQITVKRGDETWQVTDEKLAELPNSVRGYVELYLGKIPTPPLPPEVERSLARGLPIPLPSDYSGVRQRIRGDAEQIERRLSDEALPRVRELQERIEGIERRLQRRLQEVEKKLEDSSATEQPRPSDVD